MIVFTDLDGCLLDERTYDHAPATPAIERLRREDIPLVLCTSKTLDELRVLAARLGHAGPWVVENGGAIVFPAGSRPGRSKRSASRDPVVVTLGVPASDLAASLRELAREVGISVEGFSSMSPARVAELTGLDLESAARAKEREYSEPFVTSATPAQLAALDRVVRATGLRLTRGGRFFHLTGDTDKGVGVRELLDRHAPRAGVGPSVALGDAPNDLPMLREVERPIVVPRPDGLPHPALVEALPEAECAPHPGPLGWNAAVMAVLDGFTLPPVRDARPEVAH